MGVRWGGGQLLIGGISALVRGDCISVFVSVFHNCGLRVGLSKYECGWCACVYDVR